jgi:PAS domain S-box-containing protein
MPDSKILIVEDEKLVADYMKSGLERLGYSIAQIASTGEEAILSAEQCKPDLALMDIHLQGQMDGIEAATQLRFRSNIPAIFITGDVEDQSLERFKAAEPLGFLLKPFTIKELQSVIETGLSNYRVAQKRNREAQEIAEARYRNLFENAVYGIFFITQTGQFIDVNASFAKIMGYASPKELVDSMSRAKQYFVSPERHRELIKELKGSGSVNGFEFEAYRKNGTKVWLSQNIRSHNDLGNKELCYEGAVQDISKRKFDEHTLKSLLARQTALLAAIPDIIMEVDVNKTYKWANNAGFEFFGNDVLGKNAACYFEGEQDIYSTINPLWSGKERSIYVESLQRRKDGQKRLLGWHCHVLKDHTGKVIGALSSARDITDIKLKEMERSKSLARQIKLNQLQQALLAPGALEQKLKRITDDIVNIFGADFCRIWLVKSGDLCRSECIYANVNDECNICRNQNKCLHLICSSGRYTHINGSAHRRIPFGYYKIGRIASGEEHLFLTNDVTTDPYIKDHGWVKELNLTSFVGYQLRRTGGEVLGVLALFSTCVLTPDENAQLDALSSIAAQLIVAAEAEKSLQKSEERFKLITEHIDEVFWLSDAENGKATYISPAFEQVWGFSRKDLYQSNEFFRNAVHPGDRERVISAFQLKKTGQPIDLEYRIINPNGTIRQIWDRGFPICDDNGQVQRYAGVAQDVTAKRHAERALKESTKYLNQLINRIGDPIFVIDRQHRYVLVNDAMCAFSGAGHKRLLGKTVRQLRLKKEVVDSIWKEECLVFERGQDSIMEEEITNEQGNVRTIVTKKTLLTDNAGNAQIVGIIRDVTDMKNAEKDRAAMEIQLRQGQKLEAIGQLAAGIAHEINTPIQYISDNIRFLQDAFNDLTKVMEAYDSLMPEANNNNSKIISFDDVKTVVENADLKYLIEEIPQAFTQSLEGLNRVASIVQAMKEFSHPGGEEKQAIDLNHAISNTVTVCRNEWKYVAEIVMDLDPALPLVPCLPGDFNQVILNLIVNASHAIADVIDNHEKHKGTIRISTRQDKDWAEIRIADTGTGIPEEHQEKVFTPFFTTKPVGKGTGQGLAISRSVIVGKHHGTIDFETESGKGTVFIIRLPLA